MAELQKMDTDAKLYFATLPKMVQESIVQSGVKATTKEDLVNISKNLMGTQANG